MSFWQRKGKRSGNQVYRLVAAIQYAPATDRLDLIDRALMNQLWLKCF